MEEINIPIILDVSPLKAKPSLLAARLLSRSPVGSVEEDHELMKRAAQGDTDAFAALYDKYRGPVLSYVRRVVRQDAIAEELTHETFLRAYAARHRYEESARFTTWLWSIARNAAIDHLRRPSSLVIGVDEESTSDLIERFASPLDDAEEALLRKVRMEQLEHCFDALPDRQREALSLCVFSGLSYEEVATTIQATLSAVKCLLHRARQGIMNCLGEAKE